MGSMLYSTAPTELLGCADGDFKAVTCGCFMLAGVPIILSTLGCHFILILKSRCRSSINSVQTL